MSPEGFRVTKTPRKLACQNCRKRRRKCNFLIPCSNCIKFQTDCVAVNEDLRKTRYTASYVKSLEEKIAYLESNLTESDTKEKTIDDIKLLNSSISLATASSASLLNVPKRDKKEVKNEYNLVENPLRSSSIYPMHSLSISKPFTSIEFKQTQTNLKNLTRSTAIMRSLSFFFKWLYPAHYFFIHRETFLSSFFGDTNTKSYYCSEELVFAMSALGAKLVKSDDELYGRSTEFYQTSKSIVLKKVFQLEDSSFADSTPSSKLAIIQTLLCLAFYDIGNGENPMAWYLSGLAFRIAHEIGLQLDPDAWSNVYENDLSKIDFEVRSRIYWGCYIADHMISILFGRTTTLKLSNSTVPETDELPEIETGIEDYIYDPTKILSMAYPLRKLIVLSRITEIFASKIFSHTNSMIQKSQYLSKFNLEMYNWKSDLSPEMVWTKQKIIESEKFNPTIAYMWYHYHLVLISYNKPYIFDFPHSRHLIEESIEELYHSLTLWKKSFGTFEKCNLYMIYTAILALQCMNTELIKGDHRMEFKSFLGSDTLHYDLAKKVLDKEVNTDELLGTLSHGTNFALEYNFDFTLLNEIDTLIGSTDTG
ncbi:hypothetical protein TPHA_0C01080 [Tetrapisispora phaffii CBS 4417]|uniref:Zn(2)-C6 fungal-type domain-containing protein n=1 Tax=Tetrapisispora phaffii (strain ATCC 24235 / CBS 4417 / NBRC 1672 / NRRL Y-8282 / UCD 70-5) TaxID=1071381 RepID=G8BR88_TETPH|nr:hypothetical protein TPHA_0C01080 [Tetrapisispora phaffii CBS 4417]CCE62264.1 hypothetical protein TPHA_0C01080 [Tetrapisispora phaffii CBS 4417]